MTESIKSGAMGCAIEEVFIILLGPLMSAVSNAPGMVSSIFSTAQVIGGGFLGVLRNIADRLNTELSCVDVQDSLLVLLTTMG
ncbi:MULTISPECIES: hypothetical protein [Streptomyces]|uniref:hypothetical protein n=1 Tax=Streptomyces TaxID=1883 RepID=UPI00069B5988|nr:hypothetical protein [Streptomyces sp. SID7805]MYU55360.1 hypothetical protein [Streptomyces sp. SID7805]